MKRRPLPPDAGLGEPKRSFDQTFSGESIFLKEFADRMPATCICERGHDRPYWTCPIHGYVTVDQ